MHFMFKYFTQDKSSWCITSSLKEKTEKTRALKTAGKWFRISAFFLNFILRRGWWIVLSSRLGQALPGLSLHNIRILEFLNSDINLEFSSSPGWKHILFTFVGTFDQSQFQVCLANIIKTTISGDLWWHETLVSISGEDNLFKCQNKIVSSSSWLLMCESTF